MSRQDIFNAALTGLLAHGVVEPPRYDITGILMDRTEDTWVAYVVALANKIANEAEDNNNG